MPPRLVELRTERHLLQPNFDGYKLVLDAMPHWIQSVESKIDRVYPDKDQYSLLHAKLFGLHNHLVADCWNANVFYYVNAEWYVIKVVFDEDTHKFEENIIVYKIPITEKVSGHFNITLQFISDKSTLISDGSGFLHIVHTGLRSKNYAWSSVYSNQVLGEPFVIVDARKECINESNEIHCLLQTIEYSGKHFESVINWLSLKQDKDNLWNVYSIKTLKGQGGVHYCALEPGCSAVYLATDHRFTFNSDSEVDIKSKTDEEEKKIMYTWLQTSEDITLTFQLPPKYDKSLLEIDTTSSKINIVYNGVRLLDGEFSHPIDNDLTTWNIDENGKIDILLNKLQSGLMWDNIFKKCNVHGEQILDANLVANIHSRLSHLCSETEAVTEAPLPSFSNQELEECDSFSEEDTALERINGITHQVTHRIPLTVHQYMFQLRRQCNEAPALCLRFDVDGCVWQPYKCSADDELWPVKHEGTLMAFGYIQSSKQQRKFTMCSPNFSYSGVSESTRHLLIYKVPSAINQNCELRRRSPGGDSVRVNVGQQYVYPIEQNGEVLGIQGSNEFVYVLTDKELIVLHIA